MSGIEELLGKIKGYGSDVSDSSVGRMASGLGGFLLDSGASMVSPAYKEGLIGQQVMERDEQRRLQGKQYSDDLWGQAAHVRDPLGAMQAGPPDEVAGTGYAGGQMGIEDYLQRQQSNPNKAIGLAASGMMRDRFSPTKANDPLAKFRAYMALSPEDQKVNDEYRRGSPLVKIDNTRQGGRWATPEEKKRLNVGPGKDIWIDPDKGPRGVNMKSEAQTSSGITAKSLMKRMELMDYTLGDDYLPLVKDNLNQFGIPDAMNNLVRSDKGRKYITGYTNMVADVVKELTGLASTDPEYQRIYKTMAFVPGDELPDMQLKRQIFDIRVDDLLAKSGLSREELMGANESAAASATDGQLKPVSEMTLEEINAELGE